MRTILPERDLKIFKVKVSGSRNDIYVLDTNFNDASVTAVAVAYEEQDKSIIDSDGFLKSHIDVELEVEFISVVASKVYTSAALPLGAAIKKRKLLEQQAINELKNPK